MGETKEVKSKKGKFELPNKKVKVVPVLRKRGMIDNPDHALFFLIENGSIDFCVPMDEFGNVVCPLTSDELEFFEDSSRSRLPFKEGDLSPFNKKEDNFWFKKENRIKLEKRGIDLDLSKAADYLKYKILKSNGKLIAPSGDVMYDKATYLFALVDEEFEVNDRVSKSDKKKEAYRLSAKIENDPDAMIDFLTVYGKKPARNAKRAFLVSEIDKIIDNDIDGFLKLIKDEDYDYRLVINKAVRNGTITKEGNKYYLKGGDVMALTNEVNNMAGAIEYIKAPENQDVYAALLAQVQDS